MGGNVGYDVETFLHNGRNFMPAERVLAGTKGKATAIGKGVVAHPDNVMAEFSSAAPFDASDFEERIRNDYAILRDHVAPMSINLSAYITLSQQVLDECELAGEIGCDVDFQYAQQRNPFQAQHLGRNRYAGGHIHFDLHREIAPDYAAIIADMMLAVPLITFGEAQGGRRATYGLPGLNRPKPYGFEYRTLSNYWLRLIVEGHDNGSHFARLVNRTATVFTEVDVGILELGARYGDQARAIIEAEDQDEARNFMVMLHEVYN